MQRTATLAAFLATLAATPALAQKQADASSKASERVVEVQRASSKDGQDAKKSYRRVERDGKVVEESGDKTLLKDKDLLRDVERDLDALLKRARANGGAHGDSRSSSSSSSRRIVIENGKVVVDEATRDGKKVKPGALPKGLQDLPGCDLDELEKLLRDVEKRGGTTSSSSRRVVVRDGKTVVDEETRDGKPLRPGQGRARAGKSGEALPKDIEDLLRKREALPENVRRRLRDFEERERRPDAKPTPAPQPARRPEVKPGKSRIG